MTEQLPPVISDRLKALCDVLERLPPKHQSAGSTYPFENFTLDEEWLELTGSAQGSVNHTLEVTFGSWHHGQPLVFTSHGPDLVAIVDVLSAHITGLNGENPILIQWIDNLQAAATHALEQDPSPNSVRRDCKPTAKQEILNQDASKKKNDKAFVQSRAPEVFEWFSSGDEILDEFRVQIASYTRQISPFDRYRDASALEYWQQISRYPEGDIIGYLALKLLRISPSSVAEERTVSTITKFNAPDRGRQKASTLIQMTQIRQHFQREERLLEDSKVQKPRIAPTLRFHDMSDMFKSSGKVSVDLRGVGASSATSGVNVVTATDSSAEDEDTDAPGLSAEEWEREAGFDEVIERVEAGSKDAFEVDGINLSDPLLLDLLSDEPIPGTITRGSTSAQKRSAPTNVGSLTAEGSRKKLAPESFQF